jgi:hypothetical protein
MAIGDGSRQNKIAREEGARVAIQNQKFRTGLSAILRTLSASL